MNAEAKGIAQFLGVFVAFGLGLCALERLEDSRLGMELLGRDLSGDYSSGIDARGSWKTLHIDPDGSCGRWVSWRQGDRQLSSSKEHGRWEIVGAGRLELRWNDGRTETVNFTSEGDEVWVGVDERSVSSADFEALSDCY